MSRAESKGNKKTVFVVGSDDYNMDLIRRIPDAGKWDVVSALTWGEMQPSSGQVDFDALYDHAVTMIDEHDRKPDAIIGYLDFPVTPLVCLLIRDYGLVGPTPGAIARCEHKYWMRLIQSQVMPDETPAFTAMNPFQPEKALNDAPPFPFWLKPVKGHSSVLGFLIRDKPDLESALHACRQSIHHFGEPFNQFLAHLDDVSEISGIDGNYAIAEELISAANQFTLEAYIHKGRVSVYGVIDSLRQGVLSSSFSRYQYPGEVPENVVERATQVSQDLLNTIGLDNSPFNVEFFWDPDTDALDLLEINPRISKSHAPLFHMVDGSSHHKVPVDLSMGKKPSMPQRDGESAVAAKFMLRSFEADGIVRRVPAELDLGKLRRILPDIEANILVETGTRLSSMLYQDSYSWELAEVFLGGRDVEMLEDAYARCCDSLEFHIQPMPML